MYGRVGWVYGRMGRAYRMDGRPSSGGDKISFSRLFVQCQVKVLVGGPLVAMLRLEADGWPVV